MPRSSSDGAVLAVPPTVAPFAASPCSAATPLANASDGPVLVAARPGSEDLRLPLDVAPDDPRVASLAAELAEHFRRYCESMPADTFERLVRQAARIRLRWPA
jgi:hypothetical protein